MSDRGPTDRATDARGVLIDIGGVVIRTPFEMLAGTERRHGLRYGALGSRGPFGVTRDAQFERITNGDLTERAYWADRASTAAPLLHTDGSTGAFMAVLYDTSQDETVRSETAALLERLEQRNDVTTSFLTNDLYDFHGAEWVDSMGVFSKADHLVDVSRHGLLKPAPAAYQLGVDRLGLPPERVVLLDDQEVNIQGARDIGIHGVLLDVTRPDLAIQRLEAWLDTPLATEVSSARTARGTP